MVRSRRSVSVIDTEINSTLEFQVQLRLYGYSIYPWNLSSELRFINVLPIIHNTGVQLFDSEKVVNINVRFSNYFFFISCKALPLVFLR